MKRFFGIKHSFNVKNYQSTFLCRNHFISKPTKYRMLNKTNGNSLKINYLVWLYYCSLFCSSSGHPPPQTCSWEQSLHFSSTYSLLRSFTAKGYSKFFPMAQLECFLSFQSSFDMGKRRRLVQRKHLPMLQCSF